ncbi:hypothetical protein JCM9957A_25490 [Kineosporia succinea]
MAPRLRWERGQHRVAARRDDRDDGVEISSGRRRQAADRSRMSAVPGTMPPIYGAARRGPTGFLSVGLWHT